MLVDTSVWIDHLRKRNSALSELLEAEQVDTHPFVIGELACGNLARRSTFLSALSLLPQTLVLSNEQALKFIEEHKLSGRGLGWVDVHLLASAMSSELKFWTMDKRLKALARDLGIAANIGN
jgi:predicted nucleic acid-binding protein